MIVGRLIDDGFLDAGRLTEVLDLGGIELNRLFLGWVRVHIPRNNNLIFNSWDVSDDQDFVILIGYVVSSNLIFYLRR